jgi:hypothetical protein
MTANEVKAYFAAMSKKPAPVKAAPVKTAPVTKTAPVAKTAPVVKTAPVAKVKPTKTAMDAQLKAMVANAAKAAPAPVKTYPAKTAPVVKTAPVKTAPAPVVKTAPAPVKGKAAPAPADLMAELNRLKAENLALKTAPVVKAAPVKAAPVVKAAPAPVVPVQRVTQKSRAIDMLVNGVSLDNLMATFGWQRHTVRGFISVLGKTYDISSSSIDGVRTYQIVGVK